MTDLRKAAEMALKALENNQPVNYCQNNNGERFPMFKEDPFRFDCNTKAIEALRQALAQPEQEPVAWMHPDGKNYKGFKSPLTTFMVNGWTPLYTAPPKREWVGLTDEEIDDLDNFDFDGYGFPINFARAIEVALKEKNT